MATSELKQLSPVRHTTVAEDALSLAHEQAKHFGVEPDSPYGKAMVDLAAQLYKANESVHSLWKITTDTLASLDRSDRVAYFNCKRFLCFQMAKLLDNLQNPMRATYQSIACEDTGFAVKGNFPLFDNVSALFSATPVITRTATYLFACTEWIEDGFKGKEPLHEIYSRLLNPTSISLANHIVDIECGPYASQYLAWNFNSGMAAIDALLANLVGYEDILLVSRNIYGGSYQLINDWYGKRSNLNVAIEWFDGYDENTFKQRLSDVESKYQDKIKEGRKIYVYLESPCNPHGNVLDVPAISKISHEHDWLVICDETVGTPFLHPSLKREDEAERPDFVVHSYTKDLAGFGNTTAGVVIGRNERMFMPKGDSCDITLPSGNTETINWDATVFWNVYYIKGAFLDADKAFEVLNGLKTFEIRVLNKSINTLVLSQVLDQHPAINVNCPALESHSNHSIMKKVMRQGLPAGLFTIDMEGNAKADVEAIDKEHFKRFLDSLEPAIGMQVTLGQTNTTALCPALTSHSELSEAALRDANIMPTTLRISVGLEDPRVLISHIKMAAKNTLPSRFFEQFPDNKEIDRLYRETYKRVHGEFIDMTPTMDELSL
ncbi:trans-sulfuration enzyme family protein [Agarilytica rhodophyticola]|uniref:trans-sulfuration enzyme family protein n=1 Tax=Agarilytica rhodophyticola TaxID=1737490 RepID=UPI000B34190D|nr:aminotransferase class I/II-fold pyridoxal phosphate-dependent enzyme [Agarilytica rhodophyticola]